MTRLLPTLVIGLGLATAVRGQTLPPNAQSVPQIADQNQFYYDASNNLKYACVAHLNHQNVTTVQKSDSTLTNIVVSGNTATVTTASAHNLYVGARVTVSGATVATALNGTYTILTVPLSTTYTFTTAGVGAATYTDAGLVISTEYPLLNAKLWTIQVFSYDSNNYLIGKTWAGALVNFELKCSDRANY